MAKRVKNPDLPTAADKRLARISNNIVASNKAAEPWRSIPPNQVTNRGEMGRVLTKEAHALGVRETKIGRITKQLSGGRGFPKRISGLPSAIDFVNTQAAKAASERETGIPYKRKVKGKGRKA